MKQTALKIITPEEPETRDKPRNAPRKLIAPYYAIDLIDMAEPGKLKLRMAELRKKRQPVKFKAEPTLADRLKLWFRIVH